MGFVAFDDPRLAGPIQTATPGSAETVNAVAALRKALLGPEHGVLSALSLGFPLNIIGLRTSTGPVAFLNPRLVAASDFRMIRGESFLLTDIVRRDVLRPHRVVVAGMRDTGEDASFTSEGLSAVQALQHLELVSGDGPLNWMSSTERLMLDPVVDPALRQSIRALYASIVEARQAEGSGETGQATVSLPVRPAEGDRLIGLGSLASRLDFDARDPIVPVNPAGRILFAFAAAAARRQLALAVGSDALAAAVAFKHVFPQTVLDLALANDALAEGPLASLRLRADDRVRLRLDGLQAYEQATGRNEVDVILVDLSAAAGKPMDEPVLVEDFRSLSRVTRGEGGLTIVAAGQRDQRIETALKGTYVHVDCWTVEGQGIAYVASKRPIARELILGRICDLALKIRTPALRPILGAKVTSLGKDGTDRERA